MTVAFAYPCHTGHRYSTAPERLRGGLIDQPRSSRARYCTDLARLELVIKFIGNPTDGDRPIVKTQPILISAP